MHDSGVWNKTNFAKMLENGKASLPEPRCLPYGGIVNMPYVFIGDDAFALKTNMMKPYPQKSLDTEKRVYNYRHSRARRISENLFGILANRWRIFRTAIKLEPKVVESIVLTTLCLHNFLRKDSSKTTNWTDRRRG